MTKPPKTPPSSDIDGVDEDRAAIDAPKNSGRDQTERMRQESEETIAKPKGNSRA